MKAEKKLKPPANNIVLGIEPGKKEKGSPLFSRFISSEKMCTLCLKAKWG
jgi:hypothetical protein